jgi:uncharacterized protein
MANVLDQELEDKLDCLRLLVRECGSALIAYSGGVDSALVMAIAQEQLGQRALACIGVSPSYPTREMRDAIALAQSLSIPYRTIETHELSDPNYAANPVNRCYFCKSELHDRLAEIARAEGWAFVLDGNNASDDPADRPGMAAAGERGVRSPLREAGITKDDVRATARHLGLPVWDKPAMPCLSSRVPHGVAITPQLLRQIESAEDVLVELGFRHFRVRHHGELARIELPAEDLPRAIDLRARIVSGVKRAGYIYVTLDLMGFRAGPSPEAGTMVYAIEIRK